MILSHVRAFIQVKPLHYKDLQFLISNGKNWVKDTFLTKDVYKAFKGRLCICCAYSNILIVFLFSFFYENE